MVCLLGGFSELFIEACLFLCGHALKYFGDFATDADGKVIVKICLCFGGWPYALASQII